MSPETSANIKKPSHSRIAMLKKNANNKKKAHKKLSSKSDHRSDNNQSLRDDLMKMMSIVQNTNTNTNTNNTAIMLGDGHPENNWEDPPNGAFYIEEETADVYLHAKGMGWVQLNGWCPDIGEEEPNDENPAEPMTGDMYVNILTANLYYFVEGFGWVLVGAGQNNSNIQEENMQNTADQADYMISKNGGLPGPPGPPGPPGFSDVFYTITGKDEQKLTIDPSVINWQIPDFQDTDYRLLENNSTLRITNCGNDPARYQVQIKLSVSRKDAPTRLVKSGVEFYLQEDDKLVPGSLTYAMMPCAGNHSVFINVIVEVLGESEIDLTIEGRSTGEGDLSLLQDSCNCWQVVKLG